jgi:hypothetical protein
MKKLPELTKAQEARIWREVRKEFPGDAMMQEIHFIQYKMHLQMKGMSIEEQVRYFNDASKAVKAERKKRKAG